MKGLQQVLPSLGGLEGIRDAINDLSDTVRWFFVHHQSMCTYFSSGRNKRGGAARQTNYDDGGPQIYLSLIVLVRGAILVVGDES